MVVLPRGVRYVCCRGQKMLGCTRVARDQGYRGQIRVVCTRKCGAGGDVFSVVLHHASEVIVELSNV